MELVQNVIKLVQTFKNINKIRRKKKRVTIGSNLCNPFVTNKY